MGVTVVAGNSGLASTVPMRSTYLLCGGKRRTCVRRMWETVGTGLLNQSGEGYMVKTDWGLPV